MTETKAQPERLTEYERAICYDTIPRVAHPMAFGLIVLYAGVVLGSFLVMAYGLRMEREVVQRWGMIAFGASVVAGIVGFLLKAIRNQILERSALAEAESVPNVESGFDDLQDPFEEHVLLRYDRHQSGDAFDITDNKGHSVYSVTPADRGHHWEVRDSAGAAHLCVDAVRGERSFTFGGIPSRLIVTRDGTETAELLRRFSFGPGTVDIVVKPTQNDGYSFRAGGIYRGDALQGRIYVIRNYVYFDVHRSAVNDGTLALFIAMIR